ncbi:MAG: sugar phosphate isomerase/epimerase, partial [Clostridiales bacterium]|nr:sugar phosphate isomerase/epimerase [Clostridiales bacterium]
MKLGVFNPVLNDKSFEDACTYLEEHGVQMVEIGCGGFPGKAHCDPKVLLNDEEKLNEFKDTLKRHH